MAKASSAESESEGFELSGITDEASRLEAIAKVQRAFQSLNDDHSSADVSSKRIRLLELWRTLVNMRQFDAPLPPPDSTVPLSETEPAPVPILADKGDIHVETTMPQSAIVAEDEMVPTSHAHHETSDPDGLSAPMHLNHHDVTRIRLRLIRPGILHDMVLPTGTVVLVHASDAHDILERGIAEILLDREPYEPQEAHASSM
jgi:hypothetical protein